MRFLFSLIATTVLFSFANRSAAVEAIERDDAPRQSVDFDFDWRFQLGDEPTAIHREFDDSGWQAVQLPHDWSIAGPFGPEHASGTGYAPGGVGWYRKRFTLDPALQGRQIAVEFDGAYQNAQVWINGQFVGSRPYGYSSFILDLTPRLDFKGENVLAVRVDHAKVADSRWYTGSGIYRHVRLRITDKVSVAPWGVFVTTPEISAEQAAVAVETEINNASDDDRTVTIRQTVWDAEREQVAAHSGSATVRRWSVAKSQAALTVMKPARWSVDSPVLYTLVTEIVDGDQVIDTARTPFGIRTIRFDADKGFFLNGENMKLKGVCLHHDAGCLGAAVPVKVLERRLRLMKEIGANAIRTSHNPPAPELLELCDRMGFLVQDEAFDEFTPPKNKWIQGRNVGLPARLGYGEIFEEWAERDIQDMVRRDRNHPSVIMWSIGNEIDYPNDPFTHPVLGNDFRSTHPRAEELIPHGKRLVRAVKELDTTRPVTAALAKVEMTNAVGFPELLDIVGYNYQEGRYGDDHKSYPQRVIYGSENDDNFGAWQAVANNEFIAGQFLWTGFDYLGEAPAWPARIFPGGIADLAGFKKPDAWWRQALWSDKPMVYLAAFQRPAGEGEQTRGFDRRALGRGGWGLGEHWNWSEGSPVRVLCATNCEEVDLMLNGKLVRTVTKNDDRQGWRAAEIDFAPGKLEAVGRNGEAEAARFALQTAGPAKKILLAADNQELAADGHDVAQVVFAVVDEHGVRVPDAEQEVAFTIDGPVRLLGIDNARTDGAVDYQDDKCTAYRGRGLAIMQSLRDAGEATITATAEGLESAHVVVRVGLDQELSPDSE
jgi:beta-galactosidase